MSRRLSVLVHPLALCLAVGALSPTYARYARAAQTPATTAAVPTPAEIVRTMVLRTALGFDSGSAKIVMTLKPAKGDSVQRQLAVAALLDGAVRRYRVRFVAPADVEGTTLLYREHGAGGEAELYMYLPAFKRTRRIVASARNGAFMGSDFTYADLEYRDVKEASFEALADERIDGVDCWHFVAKPTSMELYGRLELWVRKDAYVAQQIKYFDRNGGFAKVYKIAAANVVDGRWVVTRSMMWTKGTGHTTFLEIPSIDTRRPPTAAEFLPETIAQ